MNRPLMKSDLEEIVSRLAEDAEEFAGKRILLTGGKGFLGRYLVEVLALLNGTALQKPCEVVVLDNSSTAAGKATLVEELPGCSYVAHDVVEPLGWDDHFDFVIHAAGIASPFYYRAHPLETLEVATIGTKNMLEVARRSQARFLFLSSSEIYGDPPSEHIPTTESYRGNVACIGPRACYDEGKRVGETLCHIYHEVHGSSTVIVRPFNFYGPGMAQLDYRVLPNFAAAIKAGKPLKIYGSGRQTRTYCYVTDGVVGIFKSLLHGVRGEPYNIGNPKPEIAVPDLVHEIEEVLGRPIPYVLTDYPDSYPADEPSRRCPDVRKARLQLGYEPQVPLREGLKRFLTWTDRYFTAE